MSTMIAAVGEAILGLFRSAERFLVVEMFRDGTRVTPVAIDAQRRRLRLARVMFAPRAYDAPLVFPRVRRVKGCTVIVSCDAAYATTVHANVDIARDADGILDEAAMENMIAQALWKLFDGARATAAKKMGIAAQDAVLADARVWRIALDGRDTFHPAGYAAKSVGIRMSVTLMPRAYCAEVRRAFPDARISVGEAGVAWARLLGSTVGERTPCIVAGLFSGHTTLASAANGAAQYEDAFEWGENDFISGVAAQFAVTGDIARYIIRAVRDGAHTSPLFAKKAEGIIAAELEVFANGLRVASERSPARKIFCVSMYELPRAAYACPVRNASRRAVGVAPVTAEDAARAFGFSLAETPAARSCAAVGAVLSVLDAFLAPPYEAANAIARRRVRWLRREDARGAGNGGAAQAERV